MTQTTLFNTHQGCPAETLLDPQTAPDKFQVILADPPWDYHDRTFLDGKVNETGAASDHYPTMSPDELMDMRVNKFAAKNSILYMWTTGPQLQISMDVMQAWGFRYKTIAYVWHKIRVNPGYYTMSSCELCIVGTKGSIPKPRGTRNERQFYEKKRTRHSAKPIHFRECIERMHPKQSKLEMFARNSGPGWYVWGNEAPNAVHLPGILGKRDDLPW
tara:strand:- start:2199 stop:2846 length:648 start_codon:yes stop_codon:yes gene_type:complete